MTVWDIQDMATLPGTMTPLPITILLQVHKRFWSIFYVYSVCGCQDYTDKNGKKFSDYISVGSAGGWQKGSWEWRRNSTKVVGWLRS